MKRDATKRQTRQIMDSFRVIVKSLREASKQSEKTTGIGAAQLFVLQKISQSREPLSINGVARETLTHQSSVSVVVRKLVQQRLVKRVASKRDARTVELAVTARGAKLIAGQHPVLQQRLVQAIHQLAANDRRGLLRGLKALIVNAGLTGESPDLFFEDTRRHLK